MRRILIIPILLALLVTPAIAAQEPASTPDAATPLMDTDPVLVAERLAEAEAPDTLPGNTDPTIEIQTWEDVYGESLDATVGAWVMTGSAQLPMATVIVFAGSDSARTGIGDFASEEAATTAGPLDAWVVADRGKWICMAADGPVLIIGQAEPDTTEAEEQEVVRERACEVTATVHDWVLDATGNANTATPEAGIDRFRHV